MSVIEKERRGGERERERETDRDRWRDRDRCSPVNDGLSLFEQHPLAFFTLRKTKTKQARSQPIPCYHYQSSRRHTPSNTHTKHRDKIFITINSKPLCPILSSANYPQNLSIKYMATIYGRSWISLLTLNSCSTRRLSHSIYIIIQPAFLVAQVM